MNVNEIIEKLEKFERLLRQFQKARNGILGSSAENTASDQLDKIEEAHLALDDFRLAAVREYEALQPVIKDFSRCFISVNAMEEKQDKTYLALIEHGTRNFHLVYDDLTFIKNQLKKQGTDCPYGGKNVMAE
jgi:hypothetical protein